MEEIYLLKKYNKLNKIINKKILLKIKKEKNKKKIFIKKI